MAFSIVTDTSANLPTPLAKQHNIHVVPFSYFINEEENLCTDTEKFDADAYYDAMREGLRVTTSQINPQRYIDTMEPLLAQGNDIVYVSMSSGISSSFASSQIAAEQLAEKYPERRIRLVDTYGASLGEGLLALRADKCRSEGMDVDQTADFLLGLRDRMYQVFTVDDLMHLRRSGRLSNISAVVGTLLHIKPLLKGNEIGKIVTFEKVRGRKSSVEALAAKYDAYVVGAENQLVGIAHAGCREDAEYLASLLKKNNPPKDILLVDYEPVTGSHVGPGTLALFFESTEGVRLK